MKKIIALVLAAMMLTLVGAAVAENPSKGGGDYNKAETDTDFIFAFSDKEELVAWANEELAKMAEAESIPAYFGKADEIAAILGDGELTVNEMLPVYAENYEESMGEQEIELAFATPYEKDADVAIMLGFKGEEAVEWSAFAGKVLDDSKILFKLDPATILKVQESSALLAVISK